MTARTAMQRVVEASAGWIGDYEKALQPGRSAPYESCRTSPVREQAHRFAGLDSRESMEHSLRLARTIRIKAEELAAKPSPHPMDVHMIRIMACRLCRLNRDHPCDPEVAAGDPDYCELELY